MTRPGRESLPLRIGRVLQFRRVTGPIVLAVSGGADSVALLRAIHTIANERGLSIIVAHVDHSLRPESAADAEWVVALAARLGVPAEVERIDVRTAAAETGRGLEETARRLRYVALGRVALRRGADHVATAHTAEDQAETVLFHVLRGTGLRGLRGMAARRRIAGGVALIRPMLDVRRTEVQAYLHGLDQPFLTDETNANVSFTRNRIRHELLPRLRETVNPRLEEALFRLAGQARETSSLIGRLARRAIEEANIESSHEVVRLDAKRLARCPRPVLREAIAIAWRRAGWPRQAMGFAHWDAIAEIVLRGGRRTLPGGTDARRRRGELILKRPSAWGG